MIRARTPPGTIVRWTGLLTTFWLTAPLAAAPPLRYQLNVGDRLVYERRVRVTALDADAVLERYTQQLQLWCLSRQQDEVLILL